MTAPALAALLSAATTEDLMAVLRQRPDWEDINHRMQRLNDYERSGDGEDFAALDPADRAAVRPPGGGVWVVPAARPGPAGPATDPEVIRYAGLVLAAIHADMAAALIPPDVGGFGAVHDHVDGNMYLIRLVPFTAAGCTCLPEPLPEGEVPGDHVYLHAEECGVRDEGGAEDRHIALCNAVAAEVDRLLREEAAADPRRPGTQLAEEVSGLQSAMLAAADRAELPARFDTEPTPPGNAMRITDRASGLSATVGLYAYGAVRELLAAMFGGDDGNVLRLPPARVRFLTDALGAKLRALPSGAAIAGDLVEMRGMLAGIAQVAPEGMLQVTARPAGAQ